MKRTFKIPASLAIVGLLAGCDFGVFDNYEEPDALLTGRVVYQGAPVGVRSNEVQLELWQPSYELNQKIPIYVDQDGTFSAEIFDGDYKLNLRAGNGPWVDSSDTLEVTVRGRAQVDVPVTPYYTVENPVIQHSNGAISATFEIGSVDTSQDVEYVGLYVSTTTFVDPANMAVRVERQRADISTLDAPITLAVDLGDELAQRADVFARIGVKTVGVDELLYSQVERISF